MPRVHRARPQLLQRLNDAKNLRFGKPSQPTAGYDYDTFAADLNKLLEELDLRAATVVGHSMGTGDVTPYLGTYGSARVERSVLVSPLQPFLLQTGDHPDGVPKSVFDGFVQSAKADMPAWMKAFLDIFFGTGTGRDASGSDEAFQANWSVAVRASVTAAAACIPTWGTDFRRDLAKTLSRLPPPGRAALYSSSGAPLPVLC
jgi:non-heme chloroperoxidase